MDEGYHAHFGRLNISSSEAGQARVRGAILCSRLRFARFRRTPSSPGPEGLRAILFPSDSEFRHSAAKGAGINAQQHCGAALALDFSASFVECPDNVISF